MASPGHGSDAYVLNDRGTEVDRTASVVVGSQFDEAGYMRGWRLHLVTLRFAKAILSEYLH